MASRDGADTPAFQQSWGPSDTIGAEAIVIAPTPHFRSIDRVCRLYLLGAWAGEACRSRTTPNSGFWR